jgi:hypothetical protein
MTPEENARWWKAATERAARVRAGWSPPTQMSEAEFRTKRQIKADRTESRRYDARQADNGWWMVGVVERGEFREIMTFESEYAARDLVKLLEEKKGETRTDVDG